MTGIGLMLTESFCFSIPGPSSVQVLKQVQDLEVLTGVLTVISPTGIVGVVLATGNTRICKIVLQL